MECLIDKKAAIISQIKRFCHLYDPSVRRDDGKPRVFFTENCPYPDLIGTTWIIEEINSLADKGYEVNSRSRCDILSGILSSKDKGGFGLEERKDFEIIYPQ